MSPLRCSASDRCKTSFKCLQWNHGRHDSRRPLLCSFMAYLLRHSRALKSQVSEDHAMVKKNPITCPRCGSRNMHLSERAEGVISAYIAPIAVRSRRIAHLVFVSGAAGRLPKRSLIASICAPSATNFRLSPERCSMLTQPGLDPA